MYYLEIISETSFVLLQLLLHCRESSFTQNFDKTLHVWNEKHKQQTNKNPPTTNVPQKEHLVSKGWSCWLNNAGWWITSVLWQTLFHLHKLHFII